jgi:hypothetical protein
MAPRKNTYGPHSRRARSARRWFKHFRKNGREPLLEGAPPLPLLPEDRLWLMSMNEGPLGYATACYATSLEGCGYDWWAHPMPEEYVRGLMACSTVPAEVRKDAEMLLRYPPKKLEGLDESTLRWSPANGFVRSLPRVTLTESAPRLRPATAAPVLSRGTGSAL